MSVFSSLKSIFTPAPRVDPSVAGPRVRSGEALLVDVREPGEWASGGADKAVLLPLSDLTGSCTQWREFLAKATGREVYVYCASGMRSARATQILAAEGIKASNAGGLSDLAATGWKIVSPGKRR